LMVKHTQTPQSAFMRAMMTPPSRPIMPRGRPNMFIRRFGPEAIPGYLMMPSDAVRNGKS